MLNHILEIVLVANHMVANLFAVDHLVDLSGIAVVRAGNALDHLHSRGPAVQRALKDLGAQLIPKDIVASQRGIILVVTNLLVVVLLMDLTMVTEAETTRRKSISRNLFVDTVVTDIPQRMRKQMILSHPLHLELQSFMSWTMLSTLNFLLKNELLTYNHFLNLLIQILQVWLQIRLGQMMMMACKVLHTARFLTIAAPLHVFVVVAQI